MPEAIIAAPSAAPDVTPATIPVTTPAAAPLANPLLTSADFSRYAEESILAGEVPPTTPVAPVVPATESPADTTPAAESETVTPPAEVADDLDTEPAPEILASLNDAGKRALQAERDKRRDARAENQRLRAELDQLKAQTPSPAEPAAPTPAPETPPITPPAPPSVTGKLMDCQTFDAVDASAMQATNDKAVASELILAMQRNDRAAVVERLKALNIEKIGAVPIDDADDASLSRLLINVQRDCEVTIQQAPARKQFLYARAESWAEAAKKLPALNDAKSPEWAAIAQVMKLAPELRNRADGPAIAVKLYLGERQWNAALPKPAAPKTPPLPAPKSAPGAPRTSGSALPKTSEVETLGAKMRDGTATARDVQRYAELSVGN